MKLMSKVKNILSFFSQKKLQGFKYTTNGEVDIKEVGEDNSFDKFLNSLTPEQKKTDILLLGDDLIYQSVVALYKFQNEVIPESRHCVQKALVLNAAKLIEHNISSLNLTQTFKGTKIDVEKEVFQISFSEKGVAQDINNIEHENVKENSEKIKDVELTFSDDKQLKKPKEKFCLLLDEKEAVLELVNTIKQKMPNENGLYISYFVANLLIILESASDLNTADFNAKLENIIVANKETGRSFVIDIKRKEVEYNVINTNSKNRIH